MQQYKKTIHTGSARIGIPAKIGGHEDIFKMVKYYLQAVLDYDSVDVVIVEYGDHTYKKYLTYVSGDDKMVKWLSIFCAINMRNCDFEVDIYNSKEKANKFMEDNAWEFV